MTFIERIILESIQNKSKTIPAIVVNTDLDSGLVQNAIESLILKGLIKGEGGKYEINQDVFLTLAQSFSYQSDKKYEIRDLIDSCIQNYFNEKMSLRDSDKDLSQNSKLLLKKVWLDEKEEKVYNSLIYNLRSFLENVSNDHPLHPKLVKNKKIVFFGSCPYKNIINDQFKIPASL